LSLGQSRPDQNVRVLEASQKVMTDGALRSRYEKAVLELRARVAAMRGDNASWETIARTLHGERRRLIAAFKELTPEPWRWQIHNRMLAAYGDRSDPTIENLRARAKSWDDIIDGATCPGSRLLFDGRLITPEDHGAGASSGSFRSPKEIMSP
jgi:hypothetical protein